LEHSWRGHFRHPAASRQIRSQVAGPLIIVVRDKGLSPVSLVIDSSSYFTGT
jgi:hypothetical protein